MNKRIDLSFNGGLPATQYTLDWMQDSYRAAFAGLAGMIGDKVIISGVAVVGGNVTSGWIAVNGELLPFVGAPVGTDVIIQEITEDRVYNDNVNHTVYYKRQATIGSGAGSFPFADLTRPGTIKELWQTGDLKQVHCDGAYIAANFDGTGLGIANRVGWAVCNGDNGTVNMGGRVAIGYDAVAIDPADNVWDVIYNTMLSTGGQKKHTLASGEQGAITAAAMVDDIGGGGTSAIARIKINGTEVPRDGAGNQGGWGSNATIAAAAAGTAHENRPPFVVTLYLMKL